MHDQIKNPSLPEVKTLNELLYFLAEKTNLSLSFLKDRHSWDEYSYQDILKDSLQLAYGLIHTGLKKGDKVGIFLPTHPDFIISFLGTLLAGGVPSALYPPLRLGKLDEWKVRTGEMLKILSAKIVLTDKKIYPFLGTPLQIAKPELGAFLVSHFAEKNYPAVPLPEVNQDDLCFVQFSSGSTGTPKGVMISHTNALSNARVIVESFLKTQKITELRTVSWLPLYHDMGLVGAWISSMLAQTPLLLLRPEQFLVKPVQWLQAMTDFKANVTVAPNFAFGLCASKIKEEELKDLDLRSWHVALCGAEMIHPKTFEAFIERFQAVHLNPHILTPVYGLAEGTLAITFSDLTEKPLFHTFDREVFESKQMAVPCLQGESGLTFASVGKPLPGYEIEIRNEDNQVLPEQYVGRLWIKGPSIMQGYLNNEEATKEVMDENRRVNTGDRAFLYQGNLYICGRLKEIIIHRGRNYDPTLIERSLQEIEGLRVGSIVAFGHFDEELATEKIIIVSELNSHFTQKKLHDVSETEQLKELLVDKIKRTVQAELHLHVDEVVLVETGTIPKTSSGKLQRNKTKELWLKGELTPPSKVGTLFVAKEMMKGMIQHWKNKN